VAENIVLCYPEREAWALFPHVPNTNVILNKPVEISLHSLTFLEFSLDFTVWKDLPYR